MFWRFAFQANAVSFEALLDKLDNEVELNTTQLLTPTKLKSLEAVLKDGELLTELKKCNDRLLQWLCKPEVINKMFDWVFENGVVFIKPEANESKPIEKSDEEEEEEENNAKDAEIDSEENNAPKVDEEEIAAGQRKLAYVSLEILAFENPQIQDALLVSSEGGLRRLWNVVNVPSGIPIPGHLSHAFGRVFNALIGRRTRAILAFLHEQPNSIEAMVNHLDDSMVLDILLKLLCLEEIAEGQGVTQWLDESKLVEHLVDRLHPSYGYDTHSNVSQVLLHILAISQASQSNNNQPTTLPNPTRCFSLIKKLTSEETLSKIVYFMLDAGIPTDAIKADPHLPSSQLISSLTFGVTIFIEIIRRHYLDGDSDSIPQNNFGNPPTAPIVDLGILVSIITRRLPDFVNLLLNPRSVTDPVENTSGSLVPLGFERLKVCELIAELLHGSNMKALNITPASVDAEEIPKLLLKRDSYLDSTHLTANTQEPELKKFVSVSFDQFGAAIEEESTQVTKLEKESSQPIAENPEAEEEAEESTLPSIGNLNIGSPKPNQQLLRTEITIGEWAKLSLLNNGVLTVFMDLFMNYPWNNFLHVVVFDIIHQVLNLSTEGESGLTNLSLIASLFLEVKLTERIITAQNLNDSRAQEPRGCRLGYMGYLTFIAEETVKLLDRAATYELGHRVQAYHQSRDWQNYVYLSLRDTKQRDMEPLDGNLTSTYMNVDNNTALDENNPAQMMSGSGSNGPELGPPSAPNEQHSNQLPDSFGNLNSTFSGNDWGVDDDDDDDDDDDEILPGPIPTHLTP